MSASEEDSKIDLLDNPANVKKKLKKAFCEPGNITDNGVLSFTKYVVFPLLKNDETFRINRSPEHGGIASFSTFEDLEASFAKLEIHPGDLKISVEEVINKLLAPIQEIFKDPKLQELTKKAYPPPTKGKTNTKNIKAGSDEITPAKLDIRVGRVIEVSRHPDADALYVEKIDLGEDEPRTVVSGLVNFVSIEEMQMRDVVVLCNLKAAKMRGVESKGMVLCASVDEPKQVEPLLAPEGSKPGDKIVIEGNDMGEPDEILNPKKKIWEKLQVDLKTNENLFAVWQNNKLINKSNGNAVTTKTMKNAPIK